MKLLLKSSLLTIISISATLFISSCGKDDTEFSSDFLEQNLQGRIDNISFEFGEGTARHSTLSDDRLTFHLYDINESPSEICEFSFGWENVFPAIQFIIPNSIGVFNLDLNNNTDDYLLFHHNKVGAGPNGEDVSTSIVATEASVEIISISESEITGKLVGEFNSELNTEIGETTVNGNFTVEFCPEN